MVKPNGTRMEKLKACHRKFGYEETEETSPFSIDQSAFNITLVLTLEGLMGHQFVLPTP